MVAFAISVMPIIRTLPAQKSGAARTSLNDGRLTAAVSVTEAIKDCAKLTLPN
jgi:hypothetical protein